VEVLITLIGQNLPPIQSPAIEKPTSASFKKLIHPAIAFWMSRKLVNAQKPTIEGPAVTRISLNPGKSEVDDKVPVLPAPGTALCRVFRMQKQNLHTLRNLIIAAKPLWINYRWDRIDLRVMAVGSTLRNLCFSKSFLDHVYAQLFLGDMANSVAHKLAEFPVVNIQQVCMFPLKRSEEFIQEP